MIPVITWEPGTSPGWTLAPITSPFLSLLKAFGLDLSTKRFLSSIYSVLLSNPFLELIVKN